MPEAPSSPRIRDVSWGRIEVEEPRDSYKDAKLFPGGCRAWDWNETGTDHVPGIQTADVRELVEKGATAVVLSRGMHERLRVRDETLRWLDERGVETRVAQTEEAVRIYNRLRDEETPVGGLFHTTC